MKRWCLFLFALACVPSAFAQRPQPSPGVGNAVLLATNSIQLDRDAAVLSGDVIVNSATAGPVLGEAALSLDRNVTTPAGYKLAATSIDLDQGAFAHGDVYYNTLTNAGTIGGAQFTPLALPVFATLPPALVRPPGSSDVVVPDGGLRILDEGAYANLIVGRGATVRLSGGGYAFQSITVARDGSVRYAAPADLVVSGRADFGNAAIVAPADGSGLTAVSMRIQVDGLNGADGALLSTPPAIHVGQGGKVFATLYATAGSLVFEQDVEGNGAFLGRDIGVGSGGHFTINSAFNRAPSANAQTVFTNGSAPLQITLTGSDAEGGALTFSIVSGPSAGTLSALTPASPTSATVTYTPAAAGAADSFTFRVTDPAGATGDAVVTINPTSGDPPPNPTTVLATDSSAQTTKDVAATLQLSGTAPAGVGLTFSIVANSGPSHGTLGAVTQGSEVPQRTATVVYTPDAGYVGADAFQFQACGVISSVTVCDTAIFAITVQTALVEPPAIASDVEVATFANTAVLISLGDGGSLQTAGHHFLVTPHAAMLDPVEIAGNVADANGDGFGDNANALPGSVPVFMSAGVNESGGPGSNGTVRMQFEWDMASIVGSASALQSAQVILPTHRGTTDALDTYFYWVGASGDGNLTNSDFEAPAEKISGAVMPVPQSMPIGGDGTFSFSVLDQVRAAAANGYSFFAIQGRVDESIAGPARGLEVRTTASGNVSTNDIPMLSLATPGITAPLQYTITALPQSGVLRDANTLITTVPYTLSGAQVTYTPNTGFLGLDTFAFEVSNGFTVGSALGKINVFIPTCVSNPSFCDNGR
jgi:hypothetical protein